MNNNISSMFTTFIAGLFAMWSLILAVGPQNAFILRQGIKREHIGVILAICIFADCLLVALGVAGVGALIEKVPVVLEILRWMGATYLLWFAFQSFRSAMRPGALQAEEGTSVQTLKSAVMTTLIITFLNPGVYLDTVGLIGALANQHGGWRWFFAFGAMLGSISWFLILGIGARSLAPLVKKPSAWQIIDIVIGIVILILAGSLAFRS
ncbi:LysE/ArgO family amino acid transporter [Arcanobacterium ihumii]|uniref:LysE/ArgO family amino acid transporter n=1 Tax=Arcanobacterium ihumii TaxID=2138162 RepID=UPI00190F7A59|nr:LysE family transporter [Arcanobacterium ihumii]